MAVDKAIKLLDRLLEAGFPENTARKIASGELPMDSASRAQRRQEQGFTGTSYHGGEGTIKGEINEGRTGFWSSTNPIVSNSYVRSDTDFKPTIYELAYNPSNMGKFMALGDSWQMLYGNNYPIRMPDGRIKMLQDDFSGGDGIMASNGFVSDTNDLASLARGLNLSGFEIQDINDMGNNIGMARRAFRDSVEKLNPGVSPERLQKEWADFLRLYEEGGDTNIVVADTSAVRSAAAAFDPDNIGKKTFLGGSGALAVGLGASDESEAAEKSKVSPEFAARMFDEIVAENAGREKNAYIPVKPTTMDYVRNAGRAIVDYFGTDQGKDMLGGVGQEIAVEAALGSLGQMIFGPAGAVGGAALLPNVAGDPTMDMLNDQGQPMTEAEFAAYRRQLRGN